MIILWRGRGLFVLLVSGIFGIILGFIPTMLIPSEEGAHQYSGYARYGGMVGAGLLCFFWGRYLKRQTGFSHSVYFVPVQLIGFLFAVVPLIIAGIDLSYGENPFKPIEWRKKTTVAKYAPAATTPLPANRHGVEEAVSYPRFKTEAEARQYALQRYPTLAIADSPFNAQFVKLHQDYTAKKPEIFQDPNWPLQLALETEQSLKSHAAPAAPEAAIAKPGP